LHFDGVMFAREARMGHLLAVVLVFLVGGTAYAAPGEQDLPAASQAPRRDPDFLFGRPDGSIAVRGSWIFSRAGSDWYDFVSDQLTIEDGDFNAPAFTFEVGFLITPKLDIVAGFDVSGASKTSEYRNFVDNNRLPITQKTELRGTTITAGVKYALLARGREVGNVAWVPSTVVPYVGVGGGAHWFKMTQQGDFVDFVDLSVFTDLFRSSGWGPSAHVFGGADVKLHRRVYLTMEARYQWTTGDLGTEWIDFEPIDLSGLQVGTGINFIF
jgi:hypothetical protein